MPGYCDAHLHLQDPRIASAESALELAKARGLQWMVVNGTRPEDWDRVLSLAAMDPCVIPSLGLHPWHVDGRDDHWRHSLLEATRSHPIGIGEVGLDRWIRHPNKPAQERALRFSVELAIEFQRPLSIHCLRAWGSLRELLTDYAPLHPGFLLHAFSGPTEMITEFVQMGAYFSFSGYFGHARKAKQREAFRAIPPDRLLMETDAPDMSPPPEWTDRSVPRQEGLNHPANIHMVYQLASQTLATPLETLITQVSRNFIQLFGPIIPSETLKTA